MYDKRKHLIGSVGATDGNRTKNAVEWFRDTIFSEEIIQPRKPQPVERMPSLLRTARSLEGGPQRSWQNRESVFLQQAKLLASYEDDYHYTGNLVRYYPTYQSLTDQELRGYFSWRTRLRRGELQKAPLSFAFLYIYELLNQVGVTNPEEGFQKLLYFRDNYGALDDGILPYLRLWLRDYVVYYDLSPQLLSDHPQLLLDKSLSVLENIQEESPASIAKALEALPLKWLARSKFYQSHKDDMDSILSRVLRRISAHYDNRCKRSFLEQYLGATQKDLDWPFNAAVFCNPLKRRDYEYVLSSHCVYRCHNNQWTVEQFYVNPRKCAKLDDLLKTIDRIVRERLDPKHPIKTKLETKWILKIIEEEVQAYFQEQEAAQARKITIDASQLMKIRRDAAITQEKLMVEEEEEPEEEPEAPATVEEAPPDTPLSDAEYRLLQCLLYQRDHSWVRREGYILSVLLDSINEKLYDVFLDSVLTPEGQPIDDYIDDLKEMVTP